jgi:hypothetical protein
MTPAPFVSGWTDRTQSVLFRVPVRTQEEDRGEDRNDGDNDEHSISVNAE